VVKLNWPLIDAEERRQGARAAAGSDGDRSNQYKCDPKPGICLQDAFLIKD